MTVPKSPSTDLDPADGLVGSAADQGESGTMPTFAKRRPYSTWAAIAVSLLLLAGLIASVAINPRMHWDTIFDYLFDRRILGGVVVTLELTAICLVIGLAIGLVIALMLTSTNPFLRTVGVLYTWIFRSVPPLVQLILWAFLAALYPTLGFGIPGTHLQVGDLTTKDTITPYIAAVIAFSLIEGAYAGETIRAGFAGVGNGQLEAGTVLGLSRGQRLFRIVLPQAMPMVLPTMGNNLTNLLKGTSIVSAIGGAELMTRTEQIYAENYLVIPLLIVAGLWYLVLTGVLSIGQRMLERHFSRSLRPQLVQAAAAVQP